MLMLGNLDLLFVATAFLFQFILIFHFSLRKWHFNTAIRYGPFVYAMSIPAAAVSLLMMRSSKTWSLWLGGFLFLTWAIFGVWIEYIRKIEWRNSWRWQILIPYVLLYLATSVFYWFPLALLWKPFWYFYAILFVISTFFNMTSHKRPAETSANL